jgi:tetratricopeptide (TPR) repeat protein
MQNNELDETNPITPNQSIGDADNPVLITSDDDLTETEKKPGSRIRLITFIGILSLIIIVVISAWSGYSSGINARTAVEATQVAIEVENQFNLGVQDLSEGQFLRARQRFEYVIELNPNYPGVTDRLAEVLLLINATATPSPMPTALPTITPDTRVLEESGEIEALFSQAEQQFLNDDWSGAIESLLQVRKKDSSYRMVQIDGMLFIALRNLGIQKISQFGELEEGLYYLSLAQRFGPLDSEAQGLLTWTKLYITGASFWELDWSQAVHYFSQVAPQLPGLRDGSGWTAKERYRLALIGFADTLMLAGDPCQALENYQLSLSLAYDPDAEQSMLEALRQCEGTQQQSPGEEPPVDQPPLEPPSDLPDPGSTPDPYPSP